MEASKNTVPNFDEGIGDRVRRKRTLHKMTQEKLSEELGITRKQFSRYELGKSEFPLQRLLTCAEILDTTIEYLLTGKDEVTTLTTKIKKLPTEAIRTPLCNLVNALSDLED